jgi:hypothetical protein
MLKILATAFSALAFAAIFISVVPVLGAAKTQLSGADKVRAAGIDNGKAIALTISECSTLGCKMVDDSACPGVRALHNGTWQDIHFRCVCNGNSAGACIDKSLQ